MATANPSVPTMMTTATATKRKRSTAAMEAWRSLCHRTEPQVVKKRQKDISDIDQKIISMYAKGMTTRQISETLDDIYGFEASEGFISDVTDKISNYRLFFTHSMGGVIYILCASLYMHFLIYKLFLS